MRKKTINFYFYNQLTDNPGTNSLFCFSNRAFRYNRQLLKYNARKKKKRKLLKSFYFYTFLRQNKQRRDLINNRITYNLWLLNKSNLRPYFVFSFYFNKYLIKTPTIQSKNIYLQLQLWYFYKNKTNLNFKKLIFNYPKTGGLSYQVARALFRKNISYQILSKYRSKVFNMNIHNEYFYNNTKQVAAYYSFLLFSIFAFSAEPSKTCTSYDEQFNISRPAALNTNVYTRNNIYKQFLSINYAYIKAPIDVNVDYEDLLFFYKNRDLIEQALTTLDVPKKMDLNNPLELQSIKTNFIGLNRFFIFNDSIQFELLQQNHLFFWIKFYLNIYIYTR